MNESNLIQHQNETQFLEFLVIFFVSKPALVSCDPVEGGKWKSYLQQLDPVEGGRWLKKEFLLCWYFHRKSSSALVMCDSLKIFTYNYIYFISIACSS